MLFAGLSEFFIIGSLIYALSQRNTEQTVVIAISHITCAFIVAATALLGALRLLEIVDFASLYQGLGFISVFFAMTGFIVTGLWVQLVADGKVIVAKILIAIALFGLVINLFTAVKLLGSAAVMLSAISAVWVLKESRSYAVVALMLLLSTLAWGAVIVDENCRVGLFHLSIGGFFSFMALAIKHQAMVVAGHAQTYRGEL